MPTGVALPDARQQLFQAAEEILLRDGPSALTSRAVTTEAGCSKGVLHHHFRDFDSFLAALVEHRVARMLDQTIELVGSAGTGDVVDNLGKALATALDSIAVEIVALVISRDTLLAELRDTTPSGIPVLAEGRKMIEAYLIAEREHGRIAADADVDTLALTLIGTAHLLFAGHQGPPLDATDLQRVVNTALSGVLA